jgi:hypothetical protein
MSGPFGAALSGWLALIFQRGRFALAPSWCSRGPQQAPQWELFASRKTFSFRRSARRPFFQCRGCRRHIILAGPRGKLGPALNLLGGHARGGARLRSLLIFICSRRGRAAPGAGRLELAKFPSENNMIWRSRPSITFESRRIVR